MLGPEGVCRPHAGMHTPLGHRYFSPRRSEWWLHGCSNERTTQTFRRGHPSPA